MELPDLDLRTGPSGERRRSPGRPRGTNPRVLHRSRTGLAPARAYHVTLEIVKGVGSLRTPAVARAIESSFDKAQVRGTFRLVDYKLADDRAFLVVEAGSAQDLGRGMKSLAARFARSANRGLGRTGALLADRYRLTALHTPKQVREALR